MPRSKNQPTQNQAPVLQVPTSIIVVERNGDLRLSQINEYSPLELCKKCKSKSPTGFEVRAEWAYSEPDEDKFTVELWARENGKAGQENKYEFPPPVDTILFFGACALVAKDMTSGHSIIPLTLEKWEKMYNFLFGGFDTLANDEPDSDDSDDSDDLIHKGQKTKDGYLKDGFVIDDTNEEFETDYEEDTSTLTDDTDDDDDDDDNDDEDDDDDDDDDNDVDDDGDEDDDGDDDHMHNRSGNILKQKCNHAKNKITPSVIKKRNPRHQLKEEIGPSFELVEESYEYYDD